MAGYFLLKKTPEVALRLAASCLVLAANMACSSQNSDPGQVQPVAKSDIIQKITVPGTVVPRRKTQITPPYAGYIQKIFVQIGETVSSNTPLVSIAQTLATRGEEVFPLRSPFAGRVVQVMRSEGEYVEPNKTDSTILRIDDLSQLFVEANVPELEYGKLKLGQQVRIKASAASAKVYSGQIRRIAEAALDKKADFGSRTNVEFAVRIQVMDADETLKPGMSALVDVIPASRTGVLTLRHEFLQRDITRLDQATVTLENGETRRVTLGLQNEEMAEITDGLKEGERVRMVDFKASAGSTMLLPGGGGGRMPRGSVRGH
jgi:multidrug efflux pump subunit AcrA (membrane-fusion protein)